MAYLDPIESNGDEDPLRAVRGIFTGIVITIVTFWLPLIIAIFWR